MVKNNVKGKGNKNFNIKMVKKKSELGLSPAPNFDRKAQKPKVEFSREPGTHTFKKTPED